MHVRQGATRPCLIDYGSGMPRSRQIFLAKGSGISECRGTAEHGYPPDCPTRNAADPPGSARTRAPEGERSVHAVSRRQAHFFIGAVRRRPCLSPVHLQGLFQCIAEILQQFRTRVPLRIDSRNLLDPANPPLAVLLNNRRIVSRHHVSPITARYSLTAVYWPLGPRTTFVIVIHVARCERPPFTEPTYRLPPSIAANRRLLVQCQGTRRIPNRCGATTEGYAGASAPASRYITFGTIERPQIRQSLLAASFCLSPAGGTFAAKGTGSKLSRVAS